MQIVDLPGFRDFALDKEKQQLADQIDNLVMRFMQDTRNVMLCVEEAGDAANLSTLSRCKRLDPGFQRTILIRNKLDKYYRDLTAQNINDWLNGFGDLPDNLSKFCMTLPHWKDGEECPKPFAELREDMNKQDLAELRSKGASEKFTSTIGFDNFTKYMERRIEVMFAQAIGPVLKKLKDLKQQNLEKEESMKDEIENTNPAQIVSTDGRLMLICLDPRRDQYNPGITFCRFVRSDAGRLTLEDELRAFAAYEEGQGADFMMLPSEDFACLDDYIDYLRNDIKVPAFDVEINGGAQFRRLMYEVEVFLRFSEIGVETKKKDVIQARGVSMGSVTWRDVVVKLLCTEALIPMKSRIRYAAERIKWFFIFQKDAVINFMLSIKGSADEQMFSSLYTKHVKLMLENEMIKQLVFKTYDDACERQLEQFMELFDNTLASTFSNPWVFLKRASSGLDNLDNGKDDNGSDDDEDSRSSNRGGDDESTDDGLDDIQLPTFEDTKKRIPMEIESRSGIETMLSHWLSSIPMEPQQIDEAVEKVQMLVLKTFSFIRSQIADQIELFAESFFKLPMMRRLEDDMSNIQMTNVDAETYKVRREYLEGEFKTIEDTLASLNECIDKLQGFALKAQAKMSRVSGSK